ncbi:MAG: addiction module protein [Pirellulaceae bacterium]
MSLTPSEVFQAAMELPQGERAQLANRLWETVDGFADAEIAAAWEAEIAERLKSADEGGEPSIPIEEVFRQLSADYGVVTD